MACSLELSMKKLYNLRACLRSKCTCTMLNESRGTYLIMRRIEFFVIKTDICFCSLSFKSIYGLVGKYIITRSLSIDLLNRNGL